MIEVLGEIRSPYKRQRTAEESESRRDSDAGGEFASVSNDQLVNSTGVRYVRPTRGALGECFA